jgi:hypothetical protein
MPQDAVEIGIGDSYAEAISSLEATPIQSVGRDSGENNAHKWAQNSGWIEDVDALETDDGPDDGPDHESLVADIEDAAENAARWEGWEWAHDPGGIVTDGPGSVNNWDKWQTKRTKQLEKILDDNDDEQASPEDIALAEREYGEQCQLDADEARDLGEQCVAAAKAGDYALALDLSEKASALERNYGDDPAYAELVDECEKALAESKWGT